MTDSDDFVTVPLDRLAHGRSGDKGDRANVSVIAWRPEFWPALVEQVTEDAVRTRFAHRRPTAVTRHLLPGLQAMNFVIDGALDGGVNDALNLDSHGKSLAYLLMDLPVRVPRIWLARLAGPPVSAADDRPAASAARRGPPA